MTTSRTSALVLGLALAFAACDSGTLDPQNDGAAGRNDCRRYGRESSGAGGTTGIGGTGGPGGASGTTGVGGTGGCIAARMSPAGAAPAEHRPTATACSPSKAPPLDGGALSCTTSADCVTDGGLWTTGATTPASHGVCSLTSA